MVREYIGARYVPKLMGTWVNTATYEALSVVDDGLGTSYTSKKPVPAGTPLTDTDYWAVTGSMSGAIISLQNRVSFLENEVINVKLYGAVGDGLTDDTAAFRSAFAAGNVIYIPEGSYLLTDYVEIPANNYIVFGPGTILDSSPAPVGGYDIGVIYAENKSNIIIDSIKVIGTGAALSSIRGSAISFDGCTNVKVVNCDMSEIAKNYAICFRNCNVATAENNYVHRFSYCGIIGLNGTNNLNVAFNTLIEPTGLNEANTYGIVLSGYDHADGGTDPIPYSLKAVGNYVKAVNPHWEGIDAHSGTGITVSDNVVENTYTGIALVGTATRYIKRVTVSGNVLNGPTSGTGYNNENCGVVFKEVEDGVISNNMVKNWGQIGTGGSNYGIRLIDSTAINVIGNEVIGSGAGNVTENALHASSCVNVNINSNQFVDNNVIRCISIANNSTEVSISDNYIRNSGNSYINAGGMNVIKPTTVKAIRNDSDNYDIASVANTIPERINAAVIGHVRGGQVGDIIINVTPTAGEPFGWICTVAETSSTPATWVALQTL